MICDLLFELNLSLLLIVSRRTRTHTSTLANTVDFQPSGAIIIVIVRHNGRASVIEISTAIGSCGSTVVVVVVIAATVIVTHQMVVAVASSAQ